MEVQFERVTGYRLGGPRGLHRMDPSRHLLPLEDSPAGATRSVPSPCWYPSARRSHDAPTIPASDCSGPACNGGSGSTGAPTSNCSHASDGSGLHTGYRSRSPTGRGRTIPSKVPAPKTGCRCRRCPRRRPGHGRCWGFLRPQ